jgi:hypothetical protein
MTMQVGMVGSDGVLIASDILRTDSLRIGPQEKLYRPRQSFGGDTKILADEKRGIVVSCARFTDTAERIAVKIFSDLSDKDFSRPCESIKAIGNALEDDYTKDAHCLISFVSQTPNLYLFHFGTMIDGSWGAICVEIKTAIAAGDHMNAAIFWKERYYWKEPSHQPKSLEQLIPLAAHTIISASKLTPGYIDGLDIVLCKSDRIQRLKPSSIQTLSVQCRE